MAKFFNIPFGAIASKATIPDIDTVNVSWNGGYSANYEYNPLTNKQAKHIERDVMNMLFYEITSTLRQLQLNGISVFYEDIILENSPGYSKGSMVYYNGVIWKSKTNTNRSAPSIKATDDWDVIYGYNELIEQLIKDGYVQENSNATSGYSKEEIDAKFNELNISLNSKFTDSSYNILGEIYLLTWTDDDRNEDGFFLCNGDELPYSSEEETNDADSSLLYYGNNLFNLCYTVDEDTGETIESEFKKRWNIVINTDEKTIKLPNILGFNNGEYASDKHSLVLTLGHESKLPSFNTEGDDIMKSFPINSSLEEAIKYGNAVERFPMLPCIYLGVNLEEIS